MPVKRTVIVLVAILGVATGWGGIGTIANVGGRERVSLNGLWQIIVDPYDFYSGSRVGGISKNRLPANKSERLEYGYGNSNTLVVPGDWNTQKERLFFYEGSVWYKRDFLYAGARDRRVALHFGAINHRADVYLNGSLLGSHEGGFTPFVFECTDRIRDGSNTLVVHVNNARTAERVPALDFDWWNFGGITRDVSLVELPSTFIEDYAVLLKKGDSSTVEGWVKLNGAEIPDEVELRIDELKVVHRVKTRGANTVSFSVRAKPRLWSPENPTLYLTAIAAGYDHISERVGFRTIATQGTSILLNGRNLFLRGICLHEEAMFTGGRIGTATQAKALFEYAKELNCNFVRLAHYPHSEEALRLADEMGLLVWAEVPVWQNISFESKAAIASAHQQLREMIVRDKNRASIILWSLSNETDLEKNGRMDFLKSMITLARGLDSTRLITSALHRQMINDTTMRFTDPLGELLDVVAVNEYIGWYQGLPRDCQRFVWETPHNKPHIVSEFGGEAMLGFHADSMTVWSEEYQASLYRNQLAMFDRVPFISGISPWILKDFRSPRRLNPDYQEYWNKKGLISNEGQRKQSFFIMKEYYLAKKNTASMAR